MLYNNLKKLRNLTLFICFIFPFSSSWGNNCPKLWNVPEKNPHFIGREEIFKKINIIFKTSDVKTAIISGSQGFGKTQTAKQYIYNNFAKYDVVWWFRANQPLQQQFEQFALMIAPILAIDIKNSIKNIGHEHLVNMIKEGIRLKKVKCLLIYDNVQNYEDIEQYIMFSHNNLAHSLITTNNANFSMNTIRIKPFDLKTSVKYINLFLPNEGQQSKEALAYRLGNCPAALALAINYVQSYPGMSIEGYLNKHSDGKTILEQENQQKLGNPLDGYEKDLFVATRMNMSEISKVSPEAFQLLGLFSLLHRDEVPVSLIESWIAKRKCKNDMQKLLSLINQYSFIEVSPANNNRGACVSMQDLIQQLVNSLIPEEQKKQLIADAVSILKPFFSDNSWTVVEKVLKNNNVLLHTIQLSEEADKISYHHPDLTFIRIRALDVLMGILRDYNRIKAILDHLSKDIASGVSFSKEDKMLYNTNLALFQGLYKSEYAKSITASTEALEIAETLEGIPEEKIRIIANLIQAHTLGGFRNKCPSLIQKGAKLLSQSQSAPYNSLYIYATAMFLIEIGDFEKTIDLIQQNKDLLEKQDFYPSMRFYGLSQLGEALIKNKQIQKAKEVLDLSEKSAKEFYGKKRESTYWGHLYVLQAMSISSTPKSFKKAEMLLKKALQTHETIFKVSDKHRNQAFAHLQLGFLYHKNKNYAMAEKHYLRSEAIFNKVLQKIDVDDVSELYKQLAILGVDIKDEGLTHDYLKKHMKAFGLEHHRSKAIILYLDKKGLILPF